MIEVNLTTLFVLILFATPVIAIIIGALIYGICEWVYETYRKIRESLK